MQTQPVDSSSIRRIGYDLSTQTLEVHHASGQKWLYRGVSQEKYDALMGAPSMGAHFNTHIKTQHPGRQI